MGVKLVSASAGSVEIVPPTTASNYTATLPAGTGTMVVNGVNSSIVSGTAVNSTSGTSIDFTSIPSWIKRVTVMLNGVTTTGSSNPLIQIGTAGTPTTSGYLATSGNIASGSASQGSYTTGFGLNSGVAGNPVSGAITIFNISGNIWVASGVTKNNTSAVQMLGGNVTLAGTLNMVRLTTVGGTDTFNAGSVNILYE